MVAQVTAILLLLLSRPMPALRIPGLLALAVVVAITLVSGADYFRRFWSVVRGRGEEKG
jgi:phosphatidylglycerophosphate synthase